MAHSTKLRFLNAFQKSDDKHKPITPPSSSNNVQGWLMNVQTYREPEEISTTIVDADNNSIPIDNPRRNRNGRPGSIASEDSVNLDELINANFTADVDDETDLPDLATLDLDDSTDEFWKLDQVDSNSKPATNTTFDNYLTTKNYDLDWNPTETELSPVMPRYEVNSRLRRSESISSDNSFNSQTTITQYAKYGLTPVMHPSESSSTSSRSISRLSNYSTTSSTTTTGIPRPNTTNIPTPSRSHTLQKDGKRTPIAKRASHIPAPATIKTPPTPQRTISSSSASRRIPTQKRLPQRASHIPTVRESIHRPNSPLTTTSRITLRSPTPGGPRNSLFPPKETTTSSLRSPSRIGAPKETTTSSLRSPSRIGTLKRTTH